MPGGRAPPWLTLTWSHGKGSRYFRAQGLRGSKSRPTKPRFPRSKSQDLMAASYCVFAGSELRSVIHCHRSNPDCVIITGSESPSAHQRPLPRIDVGSCRTQVPTWDSLSLWAVTQYLPCTGTCPFTQWLPTREVAMFMSVVVNKGYTLEEGTLVYPVKLHGNAGFWSVFLSGSPDPYCS